MARGRSGSWYYQRWGAGVVTAGERRRFFLSQTLRRRPIGSGSDLERLMVLPRERVGFMALQYFKGIDAMLIGAHAANAYMPSRNTADVDVLVRSGAFQPTEAAFERDGWKRGRTLLFPNAKLGLHGTAWTHPVTNEEVDLITSAQSWVNAAFDAEAVLDSNGARVIPLPFLVLMKLDSARVTDQGDLSRMLGRADTATIDNVVDTVLRFYDDPQAADDIRQYAAVGRWEYDSL